MILIVEVTTNFQIQIRLICNIEQEFRIFNQYMVQDLELMLVINMMGEMTIG